MMLSFLEQLGRGLESDQSGEPRHKEWYVSGISILPHSAISMGLHKTYRIIVNKDSLWELQHEVIHRRIKSTTSSWSSVVIDPKHTQITVARSELPPAISILGLTMNKNQEELMNCYEKGQVVCMLGDDEAVGKECYALCLGVLYPQLSQNTKSSHTEQLLLVRATKEWIELTVGDKEVVCQWSKSAWASVWDGQECGVLCVLKNASVLGLSKSAIDTCTQLIKESFPKTFANAERSVLERELVGGVRQLTRSL